MDEHQDQTLNQSLMPCTLSKTSIQSVINQVNENNEMRNNGKFLLDFVFKINFLTFFSRLLYQ